MSNNNNPLLQQFKQVIGGEWKAAEGASTVEGYISSFPQFRAEAVAGVLNRVAKDNGLSGQVQLMPKSDMATQMGDDPNAPRDVVLPKQLAENPSFQKALTDDIKYTITNAVTARLSHGVGQGITR